MFSCMFPTNILYKFLAYSRVSQPFSSYKDTVKGVLSPSLDNGYYYMSNSTPQVTIE